MDLMVVMCWADGTGALAPGDATYEDDGLAAAMDRWNERVKRDVPADRLLVWEPREGWEPLCEFLEVPVPDEPLPNTNDTLAFKEGHPRWRDRGRERVVGTARPAHRRAARRIARLTAPRRTIGGPRPLARRVRGQPAEHLPGVLVWREHGVEDVLDPAVGDHERHPLVEPLPTGGERRQVEGVAELVVGVG